MLHYILCCTISYVAHTGAINNNGYTYSENKSVKFSKNLISKSIIDTTSHEFSTVGRPIGEYGHAHSQLPQSHWLWTY